MEEAMNDLYLIRKLRSLKNGSSADIRKIDVCLKGQ
jgi:hypothetical protein